MVVIRFAIYEVASENCNHGGITIIYLGRISKDRIVGQNRMPQQ